MSERLDYTKASPGGVKAFGSVYGYIMQSGLDDVLVDLVYLRVSQINGCAYCLDMHTRDLIKKGTTIEKLALLQAWPLKQPMPGAVGEIELVVLKDRPGQVTAPRAELVAVVKGILSRGGPSS